MRNQETLRPGRQTLSEERGRRLQLTVRSPWSDLAWHLPTPDLDHVLLPLTGGAEEV
jgi:hypothetical protein